MVNKTCSRSEITNTKGDNTGGGSETSSIRSKCSTQNPSNTSASLTDLIIWNISKVVDEIPNLNLEVALQEAQERIKAAARDCCKMGSVDKTERHLDCALLAWQQMGHVNSDSLHKFVTTHCPFVCQRKTLEAKKSCNLDHLTPQFKIKESVPNKSCSSTANRAMGPVIKLPNDKNVVMRVNNSCTVPKMRGAQDTKCEVCTMDTEQIKQLKEIEEITREQRKRAATLLKREAERIELLAKAEAAWKELESGYERQLKTSKETEEDLQKKVEKLVNDHAKLKKACSDYAKDLSSKTVEAEKEKDKLAAIEDSYQKHLCTKTCLIEETICIGDAIADHQCKLSQVERELQYREEQTRCKKLSFESELESARALTYETERLLHGELSALTKQIADHNNEFTSIQGINAKLTNKLSQYEKEKENMMEDLSTCRINCDQRIQKEINALKLKREELAKMQNKVLECRCKLPQERQVEAKRTPSLVMCHCASARKFNTDSSTSVKAKIMSDLLNELFTGLQSELEEGGARMPCELLKCLEDKHDWDRCTPLKTNVLRYFNSLLVTELDIAIASLINQYHGKLRNLASIRTHKCSSVEEVRAQRLACQLADQIIRGAPQDGSTSPACSIKQKEPKNTRKVKTSLYHCTLNTPLVKNRLWEEDKSNKMWQRTQHNITQLRTQIQDLKKDTIKIKDLNSIKETIKKLVEKTSSVDIYKKNKDLGLYPDDVQKTPNRKVSCQLKRLNYSRKRLNEPLIMNARINHKRDTSIIRRNIQAVNVNVCQLDSSPFKRNLPPVTSAKPETRSSPTKLNEANKHQSEVNSPKTPSNKLTVPSPLQPLIINCDIIPQGLPKVTDNQIENQQSSYSCPSNGYCFHKKPSLTSMNRLFDTLNNWKLNVPETKDKTDNQNNLPNCNNENTNTSCKKEIEVPIESLNSPDYTISVEKDKSFEADAIICDVESNIEKNIIDEKLNLINQHNLTSAVPKKNSIHNSKHTSEEYLEEFYKSTKLEQQESSEISQCSYKIKFLGATITDDEKISHQFGDHCNVSKKENNNKMFDDDSSRENFAVCESEIRYKELEKNVYDLITDHLKGKVDRITKLHKTKPISYTDRQNLVSSILENVKHTISDCTKHLQDCVLANNNEIDESWKRAHSLLQEYLKKKLKRADCVCIAQNKTMVYEKLMPTVLDKVIELIDLDFNKLKYYFDERLKGQHKNEKTKRDKNRDMHDRLNCYEIPERDTTDSSSKTSKNFYCSTKQYPEPISNSGKEKCTENSSLQVPSYTLTNNQFVEVFCEKSYKCLQTEYNLRDNCCSVVPLNQDESIDCTLIEGLEERNTSMHANKEKFEYDIGKLIYTEDTYDRHIKLKNKCNSLPSKGFNVWSKPANKNSTSGTNKANDILKHDDYSRSLSLTDYKNTSTKSSKKTQPLPNFFNTGEVSTHQGSRLYNKSSINLQSTSASKTSGSKVTVIEGITRNSSVKSLTHHENFANDKIVKRVSFNFKNSRGVQSDHCLSGTINYSIMDFDKDQQCDCNLVPICHVKKLVTNIESQLLHSKCTCDILSMDVCPIHSNH